MMISEVPTLYSNFSCHRHHLWEVILEAGYMEEASENCLAAPLLLLASKLLNWEQGVHRA